MPKKNACCGNGAGTLILACSGSSNVGQISNNIMVEMAKKGLGSAYCLTGLGVDLPGFAENSRAAKVYSLTAALLPAEKLRLKSMGLSLRSIM